MGTSSQYSFPTMDRWFLLRAKRLALKPAFVMVSKEEAFATDEHGITRNKKENQSRKR